MEPGASNKNWKSFDRFLFTLLSGNTGTDTWSNTSEELAEGTDPLDPDTDGDGYWDGWIGVYGVNRSENVILYREYLQSGDGIEGDEILQEQTTVHELSSQTGSISNVGANIDSDSAIEHSAVHVGELHWDTNPLSLGTDSDGSQPGSADTVGQKFSQPPCVEDRSSDGISAGTAGRIPRTSVRQYEEIPSPTFSLEVDYYAGATDDQLLNTSAWERGIEENMGLYGINVDIIRDETHHNFNQLLQVEMGNGVAVRELIDIEGAQGDDYNTEEFLLIANEPESGSVFLQEGLAGFNPKDIPLVTEGQGMMIFNNNLISEDANEVDYNESVS